MSTFTITRFTTVYGKKIPVNTDSSLDSNNIRPFKSIWMKRDEVPQNNSTRAPIAISDSTSANREYLNSLIDYILVEIRRCLGLNKSKDEAIEYISTQRDKQVHPAYVKTVWDRLEKENPEFFYDYYRGIQHREHPTFTPTVNDSLMGYSAQEQFPDPSYNQLHFNSTSHGIPNHMHYPFNVENNVLMESSAASMVQFVPPISFTSSTSKIIANASSRASSQGIANASSRASSQGLQLAQDNGDLDTEYLWDYPLPQPTSDVLSTDSGALGDNFPPLPDHFELTYDESEVYELISKWQ
ncbi:hypothetical protein SO802_017248 [Lithocarpus litseifolius]|uniref:Uncharacterized protein n=1 Tax=Lithocarpus litseifolius TaxID=425828 RepID=A0AAW2D0V6_9ROSI